MAVARKLLVRLFIMVHDQIDYAEFRRRGHSQAPRQDLHRSPALRAPAAREDSESGAAVPVRASRSIDGPSMTDLLVEMPLSRGDPGSSTIEHDIMRRCPVREWMVGGTLPRARGPPKRLMGVRPQVGDTTVSPPPRSSILGQLCDRV